MSDTPLALGENFYLPEFPLTGSGKVQQFKQKAWAIDTYGFKPSA